MVKYNRKMLEDKIYACWIGKNIGGTIGGPFEGKREILDVKGFTSEKGDPLPNDDLDLQLIWLCAMEEVGPYQLTARELGEYWINYLPPHWNEYGIGKANMKAGILPPLCGELNNEQWKHSNGAWIRSEIWACLAPGFPQIARRYAFEDACVDHGMGEGTVAEQFTATLESLAFFATDIRAVLDEALEAIPADSRVAKAVRRVMEGYDRGEDWKDVRNALVEQSADIGWFQAPANVGYVVLGLLYGEGDFKKSMLYAVNCGDDTDCTAATVGAFLGIFYGMEGIPKDWAEYIGDKIITISVDRSYTRAKSLSSCTELTRRVMQMIPSVLTANSIPAELTDGETVLGEGEEFKINSRTVRLDYEKNPLDRPQNCIEVWNTSLMRVRVEFDHQPVLLPGEEVKVTLNVTNKMPCPLNLDVRLILPEGIAADRSCGRMYIPHKSSRGTGWNEWSFTVTATEEMRAMNRIIVEMDCPGRPQPALFAVPILAK